MIIGISGYMGSGKNLICKIIQGLSVAKENNIENANYEWIERFHLNSEWKQKAFAGKLKQIASLMTGIPVEKFEDQEFKKTYLGEEGDRKVNISTGYGAEGALPFESVDDILLWGDTGKPMTVREFLQKLGTEAIRDNLHPDSWVNALMVDYKEYKDIQAGSMYPVINKLPNWIITDLRFPNEARVIKQHQGITLRVNRETHKVASLVHESEIALNDYEFDYVIDNNGTIDELIEKVREFLNKFNIL